MSRLLHLAEREARKVHKKHEQINGTEDVDIFLDLGRDGEENLQLLTTIKDLPKRIAKEICDSERKKYY